MLRSCNNQRSVRRSSRYLRAHKNSRGRLDSILTRSSGEIWLADNVRVGIIRGAPIQKPGSLIFREDCPATPCDNKHHGGGQAFSAIQLVRQQATVPRLCTSYPRNQDPGYRSNQKRSWRAGPERRRRIRSLGFSSSSSS